MGKNDQTVTQKPDPTSERYRNIYWNATLNRLGMGNMADYSKSGQYMGAGAAAASPSNFFQRSPLSTNPFPTAPVQPNMDPGQVTGGGYPGSAGDSVVGVADYDPGFQDAYSGMSGLGDAALKQSGLGFDAANRALDPAQFGAAAQGYMNPYIEGVIDPLRAQFDESRARALTAVKQNAASQGAYGGSRHGVAEGEASRGIALDENAALAKLYAGGYENAANRAMQAGQLGANLGLGAGGLANQALLGQGGFSEQLRQLNQSRMDIPIRELGLLGAALGQGPTGQTTTQPTSSNPFLGAVGGAAAGTAIAPGIGTGIGAGIGLLGSLF